jgi:hypothetical protein
VSYLLGDAAAAGLGAVADHLDACRTCQARVEALGEVTDPLLAELRGLTPGPHGDPDPELCRLIGRAQALGGDLADLTADPEPSPDLERIGDYELLRKLGAGSFGTVYLARGLLLRRLVAVKVLREPHRANPDVAARFLREMRAVGRLQAHPHVVQAFQASEEAGTLFLVMEYVEGQSLDLVARARGPLPVGAACEAVRQAALGLQHIHENGLVHRDVKPANLILAADGRVKVLDLGLARLTEDAAVDDRRTAQGQVIGTFDYLAPEQALDARSVDIRADVYSLGCTLYRLLAGRVPFPAADRLAKVEAHRFREPPPLADSRPDLPAGLPAVVRRMMAKAPAERYPTPREAAAALGPFAASADLLTLARPAAAAPSAEPTATDPLPARRRWPWVAPVAAGLFLVAAGLGLAGWLKGRRPAGEPGELPGPVAKLAGLHGPGYALAFAPDGQSAVAEDGTHLHLWDLARRERRWSWDHGSRGLRNSNPAFTVGARRVALALNDLPGRARVQLLDAADGQPAGDPLESGAAVLCVAASPDGGRLFTADNAGRAKVWDAGTRTRLHEFRLAALARSAAFPNGRRLLCGCDDGAVRLYTPDGRVERTFPGPPAGEAAFVVAVALSDDGRRVCAAFQVGRSFARGTRGPGRWRQHWPPRAWAALPSRRTGGWR